MVSVHVNWHGEEAMDDVRLVVWKSVQKAVVFLWEKVQEALDVPNTGVRVKRLFRRGSYTVYPDPSKPGEPPRKRTGYGQRNVLYSLDQREGTGRVGVSANAEYMAYLEVGTRRVAARPWLMATAQAVLPQLRAIFFREHWGP